MFLQFLKIFNKTIGKTMINNFSSTFDQGFRNDINKKYLQMSKKLERTFIENLLIYWKNLYIDYKEVILNFYDHFKTHPIKSTLYITLGGTSYYFADHNPNEIVFREQLVNSMLRLLQVSDCVRNPITVNYLKWLEQCHNEGILRQQNFLIISVLWLDNYDNACALYKTTCCYLKPQYITFYKRIIDIGFLDKWWILENSMIDYDVNNPKKLA